LQLYSTITSALTFAQEGAGMVIHLVVALGLFQFRADPVRGAEMAQRVLKESAAQSQHDAAAKVEDERRRFAEALDRLSVALDDFRKEYEAGGGQVWPAKKAELLKKAIRELRLH
jgi:hypothetical protein